MSQFPTLNQMGITSLHAITRYTLQQEGEADVLKVYYLRSEGSPLPLSMKYAFARPEATNKDQASAANGATIDPTLRQALDELKRLRRGDSDSRASYQRILEDLNHFEQVVSAKVDELRGALAAWK